MRTVHDKNWMGSMSTVATSELGMNDPCELFWGSGSQVYEFAMGFALAGYDIMNFKIQKIL